MATTKRERQKANRQLRLQEMAKQARKTKRKRRGLWIGVLIVVVVAVAGISAFISSDTKKPITVSELLSTDLVVGTGDPAVVGDTLAVHYVGTLLDGGTVFDSNKDPAVPFKIGRAHV